MLNRFTLLLSPALLSPALLALVACAPLAGTQPATTATAPTSTPVTPAPAPVVVAAVPVAAPLELPPSAAPAAELAPFAFMTGRWIGVNPNKTVNEEHWTTPRGNHMLGTFHQIRRDGKPAFVELSLITVEKDGIKLRLRHLHAALEVPESRKELSVFVMKAAGDNRVEFTGTGDAQQVTGVTYRLVSPDELAVDVAFAPTSKEKGFTSRYVRER